MHWLMNKKRVTYWPNKIDQVKFGIVQVKSDVFIYTDKRIYARN